MGLLDALFQDSGQGGGLLDFLKGNAAFQQPMQGGLQSDQAQYPGQPQYAPQPMNAMAQAPSMPPMQANAPMPQSAPQQAMPAQAPAMPVAPSRGGFAQGVGDFLGNLHTGPVGAIVGGLAGGLGLQDSHTRQVQQAQNQTYQYFISRGVDPVAAQAAVSNPEVMKSMIDQMKLKPPTALGSGYIYNPQTNKVERAYEPEDKIPAGYERTSDGKGLQFIKGGPEDPATQLRLKKEGVDPNASKVLGRGGEIYHVGPDGNVVIDHKNQADMEPMDPASLEILARREISGDFSGRKNLGRGAQGAADLKAITNKSSEILTNEMGMTPTEAAAHLLKKQQEYDAQGQGLRAEARTTGVREANLNLILKAADAAIPAALEASDRVSRTGWVPINKIVQGGQVMASDPDLKKFGMANLQLAEHWARAMNPTGVMRESDRDKALSFLSTADSKETYREAVGQLRTQIERERDAVRSTRGMATMPGVVEPSTSPKGAPAPGAYVWSPNGGVQPK